MQLHPDFIAQTKLAFPDESGEMIAAIAQSAPEVSIRINPDKVPQARLAALDPVPWCPLGAYLNQRPQFTFDIDFQAGNYYVQDASSMFIAQVISQLVTSPVRYLDLCAAPGGKTTTAISALPQGSMVLANEIVPARAKILAQNVAKWGNDHCFVSSDSPAKIGKLTHYFDVIAADVPCSGEGMFRKDEEAVAQWSPQLVKECASRQQSIINDVWPALKPGGLLIYSTCTYNTVENEDMVDYIVNTLGAEPLSVSTQPSWAIHAAAKGDIPCYRFLPHLTKGEGLFMCVLRKPDSETPRSILRQKKKLGNKPKGSPAPAEVKNWLTPSNRFDFALADNIVIATPTDCHDDINLLSSNLHMLLSGITVATCKGRNVIPTQQLAWSSCINTSAFASVEVTYPEAIAFLQRQALVVNAPKGYVLLTYKGTPLGFINNLGSRANNLYPKEYRILNPHTPDQPPTVLL